MTRINLVISKITGERTDVIRWGVSILAKDQFCGLFKSEGFERAILRGLFGRKSANENTFVRWVGGGGV